MERFWPLESQEKNQKTQPQKKSLPKTNETEDLDDPDKKNKVLRSELLHHKYFYLNEEVDREIYSRKGPN